MTKQEFIEKVAQKTKFPKGEVAEVINSSIDEISSSINKGITFTGFGTFSVSKRKARAGRNPKTGETINIPAMKVPKFKAGKVLKDKVR